MTEVGTAEWNGPQQTSETRSSGTLPNRREIRLDEKQPARRLSKQTTTHKNTSSTARLKFPCPIKCKENDKTYYECNYASKKRYIINKQRIPATGPCASASSTERGESLSPLQKWCSSSGSTGIWQCAILGSVSCLPTSQAKSEESPTSLPGVTGLVTKVRLNGDPVDTSQRSRRRNRLEGCGLNGPDSSWGPDRC